MPVKVVRYEESLARKERQNPRSDHRAVGFGHAERGSECCWLSQRGSNRMQTQFAMAVFHLPVRKRSHIQMQRAVLSRHMQTMVEGRLRWKT